ncbi:hypothetical protein [Streptomyces mobaraensis]|uniref:Uncharacterized protein n=1 Tax=Streptomyces mobaraensis TaxID=35621 RepID=A0A5N5VZF1_STRMB|nr:hypothetical protein [Streptomyces mobaraensis]KAB7833550.1 hypothetical protein FRZ00_33440 [Streptomyces mobaraensis]
MILSLEHRVALLAVTVAVTSGLVASDTVLSLFSTGLGTAGTTYAVTVGVAAARMRELRLLGVLAATTKGIVLSAMGAAFLLYAAGRSVAHLLGVG